MTAVLLACGDNRAAIVDAGAPLDAAIDAAEPVYEGPPPEQDVVRSGTRLRAHFLGDPAGAREHRGMYDTATGEDCTWSGADGWRCLPGHEPDELFADASCVEHVGIDERPCAARYLGVFDRSREPWRLRELHELEATYQPAAPLWRFENGACRPAVTRRYRRVARRVDIGAYARGFERLAGDGRVQTVTIVSADGSWTPRFYAYDRTLGSYCDPRSDLAACVPTAPGTGTYADAACSRPVLIVPAGDPVPRHIRTYGPLTDTVAIYEAGAVLDPDNPDLDLHDLGGGECTAHTEEVPPGATLLAAGPLVPFDAMPPVVVVPSGDRPLGESRCVAGELDQHAGFRDAARDSDCDVVADVGGGWRCLPPSLPTVKRFFSGADCVATVDLIQGVQDVDRDTIAVRPVATDCGRVVAAEAVGAVYPFPLWVGRPGDCVAIHPVLYQPAGPATFDGYPALEEWVA
jgi:hypothetical protein